MTPRKTSPAKPPSVWLILAVVVLVGLGLPILGAVIGSRFGLENGWYGAIGSWFGAIASTGAILWGVTVFRRDHEVAAEQTRAELDAELEEANALQVYVEPDNSRSPRHDPISGTIVHLPAVDMLSGINVTLINDSTKVVNVRSVAIEGGPTGTRRQGLTALRLEPTKREVLSWVVKPGLVVEEPHTAESLAGTGCFARVRFDQGGGEWERTSRDLVATRVAPGDQTLAN